MSLSRDEWAKMWEAIKALEYELETIGKVFLVGRMSPTMESNIKFIKEKIQQVIGQME